jgi:hypothetical protein
MKRAPSLLTAALALLLLTAPVLVTRAYAIPITFVASLRGDNEVPPTGSPGTGFATVVLDPAAHTMHVDVTFAGLVSPTTVAHIHCCLPSPLASGVNVMVATTTPTFPGFPAGVLAGTYSHDFDLTLASSYNPAFITSPIFNPSGTVAGAEAALEAGIQNRETYLNVHTVMFGGGEIRGFLVVPEPGTLLLLVAGFAGLSGLTWSRRRRN